MSAFDDDDDPDATADAIEQACADTAARLAGGELRIRRCAIELIVQTQQYLRHVAEQQPGADPG